MIYDLHTHSTHSDGMLIPAEVARTAQVQGYLGIALTDHVDSSNIYQVLQANLKFKEWFNKFIPCYFCKWCNIFWIYMSDFYTNNDFKII